MQGKQDDKDRPCQNEYLEYGRSHDARNITYAHGIFLRKDSTSCLVIRFQPSTKTKRISLKGVEIMTGGNMIIPMDMRIEATTISMMMKGMKSNIPILNAIVSSLSMKDGMSM